jgi:putative hydrolase of the HAD superfamily
MTRPAEPPLRAVTFDFWNTLIRADDGGVRDRRLTAWLGLLAGEGIDLDPQLVHGAMSHAGTRFEESWHANRIYRADEAVGDMLEHLRIDAGPELRVRLVASITNPDPAHDPHPTPNVRAALEDLRAAGIRIGIICDVGLSPSTTLRRYLQRHDLLGLFDHWSFSDEVGVFKPDPVIFQDALDGLGGVDPWEAAHVGDLRRTDIAGAQGVGMFAVRYAGVADDPGSAEHGTDVVDGDAVISDHADLTTVLGLS